NVDMDITAEEMRRLFGLPDMQPIHDEMLEKMKAHVADSMDPAKMVETYMSNSASSMDAFQKMMSGFMTGSKPDR
ncbi:MAG: hypothetical protein GY764_11795, partial [Halieaceae bacterium]|nr:hypothetical protein [Halieaceae bacterium]